MNGLSTKLCANCMTASEDLKHCARCKSVNYCSRDCQKANWKHHKKVCGKVNTPPSVGSEEEFPFHHLEAGTWLHNRPEKEIFKLLIDIYRFRATDNMNLEGKTDPDDILGGATDSSVAFRRFLELAGGRVGLLPPWWTTEKVAECVDFGLDTTEWQSLRRARDKSDIIEHYGDACMPTKLRLLGEQVYGTGPGGQAGAMVLQVMKLSEARGGVHSIVGM
ncbi:hypothetical protein H072_3631 [Dactylellina haptotyla CBS 200.50]|uniref:MYND-type domain-containing protein n=1 Tax=Dactylellina haptotyla (strain CBS 200.50) TaxID=1284197 RepID=S8AH82_DACHA|nr:hypothetical protein H072_3631 [Dactylellina haptotyla CBS 200.50]